MKIIIVIPAYNEEKTIANVIGDAQGISDEVIVINDASFDRTKTIAQHMGAMVYSHVINLGLGAALITGFTAALKYGADIVVTMDADGQHRAHDAQNLIKEIAEGTADVVIGSRLLYKNGDSMPFVRRIYNYIANGITYIAGGARTSDSQSGLRAFSRYALEKIQLKSQRMEVSTEFFREIKRNNLQLKEVPIRAIYTTYSLSKGQSFMTGIKTLFRLIINKLV